MKYAREEIAEDLGVSIPTAVKVMKELAKYDLIQEINLGRGESKVIYIMKPILEEIDMYKKEPGSLETQQTLKILKSRFQKSLSLEFKNFKRNDTYINENNNSETYNYYPEPQTESAKESSTTETLSKCGSSSCASTSEIETLVEKILDKKLSDTFAAKVAKSYGLQEVEKAARAVAAYAAQGKQIRSVEGMLLAALQGKWEPPTSLAARPRPVPISTTDDDKYRDLYRLV
ncbi:MAG: hypothetical protein L5656_05350 [Thermanaeromonas sp.]|uniref:hypothetical protein n=1 Tax=Thermanaeromonas sp. TaxID=2003697 RepID=UPI0024387C35|nr:hypothetical protein [Thermanaeromonas sp.]MCG0277938.1 hypothetical protein [Thermanaeromonas sp.]